MHLLSSYKSSLYNHVGGFLFVWMDSYNFFESGISSLLDSTQKNKGISSLEAIFLLPQVNQRKRWDNINIDCILMVQQIYCLAINYPYRKQLTAQ
jgi:hypothetical protein